ncbi:hypothetical protein ABLE91_11370 [Aquabacter sp. CN5-332]|uniref:hypothetical protein n=1 Tax=Aquabacter sp. CN5-332 TaxID=3156608 RepID=UPI0032B3B939
MLARNEASHDVTKDGGHRHPVHSLKYAATQALWFSPLILAVIVLRYAIAAM